MKLNVLTALILAWMIATTANAVSYPPTIVWSSDAAMVSTILNGVTSVPGATGHFYMRAEPTSAPSSTFCAPGFDGYLYNTSGYISMCDDNGLIPNPLNDYVELYGNISKGTVNIDYYFSIYNETTYTNATRLVYVYDPSSMIDSLWCEPQFTYGQSCNFSATSPHAVNSANLRVCVRQGIPGLSGIGYNAYTTLGIHELNDYQNTSVFYFTNHKLNLFEGDGYNINATRYYLENDDDAVICATTSTTPTTSIPTTSTLPPVGGSGSCQPCFMTLNKLNTSERLANTVVNISGSQYSSCITNSSGECCFSDIIEGNYLVQARKLGYDEYAKTIPLNVGMEMETLSLIPHQDDFTLTFNITGGETGANTFLYAYECDDSFTYTSITSKEQLSSLTSSFKCKDILDSPQYPVDGIYSHTYTPSKSSVIMVAWDTTSNPTQIKSQKVQYNLYPTDIYMGYFDLSDDTYDISIYVKDASTTEVLDDVTYEIYQNGAFLESGTTAGPINITYDPTLTYCFGLSKAGYKTLKRTDANACRVLSGVSVNIYLTPLSSAESQTVTITVQGADESGLSDLEGIRVSAVCKDEGKENVYDDYDRTDSDGEAVFSGIANRSTCIFSASGNNEYNSNSITGVYVNSDLARTIILTKKYDSSTGTFTLWFTVFKFDPVVTNARIGINAAEIILNYDGDIYKYYTDSDGKAEIIGLDSGGTYSYSVTKKDFDTKTGTVQDDNQIEVELIPTEGYYCKVNVAALWKADDNTPPEVIKNLLVTAYLTYTTGDFKTAITQGYTSLTDGTVTLEVPCHTKIAIEATYKNNNDIVFKQTLGEGSVVDAVLTFKGTGTVNQEGRNFLMLVLEALIPMFALCCFLFAIYVFLVFKNALFKEMEGDD